LKIKNETVYVIYLNGEPYSESGRKLVYTTKGAANGVITYDAEQEARRRYDELRKKSGYEMLDWYYDTEEKKQLIEEVRSQFEVVEYAPKKTDLKKLLDKLKSYVESLHEEACEDCVLTNDEYIEGFRTALLSVLKKISELDKGGSE
jgi:hypothetical protein